MPFGGFAPLPLRLGGSPIDGWSASQHARMVADLAAAKRAAPVAVITYTPDSIGGDVTIHGYLGRNGVGSAHAPSPIVNGAGDVTLDFPASWEDDFGRVGTFNFIFATYGLGSTDGGKVVVDCDDNAARVRTYNNASVASDERVTVVLYGSTDDDSPLGNSVDIGDYDGDTAKRDSSTEGSRPYAWLWYRELQAMRGSAYTTKTGTIVDAEHIATARALMAIQRASEKFVANSLPATADERVDYWAEVLRPPTREGDKRWQRRQLCAAHYQAAVGPTETNVDAAVARLLGDVYVASWRQIGVDLDNPPTITYWPGVNPGPAAYSLGGGAWLSERAHLVIEVQQPATMSTREFLYLVNVQLFALLNRMLPAYDTFNWALAPLSSGFLLDISSLDFHGFNP